MFGGGMVISVTPMGNDHLVEVAFDGVGTKKVMAKFARLEENLTGFLVECSRFVKNALLRFDRFRQLQSV